MARILIIEDYYAIRELYSDLLSTGGHKVETAGDGETGLKKILSGGYDLILIDLLLPKINGLDILKELQRQKPRNPNGKMVAMAVLDQDDLVNEALKNGAAGFVIKTSLSPNEVIKKIESFLEEKT